MCVSVCERARVRVCVFENVKHKAAKLDVHLHSLFNRTICIMEKHIFLYGTMKLGKTKTGITVCCGHWRWQTNDNMHDEGRGEEWKYDHNISFLGQTSETNWNRIQILLRVFSLQKFFHLSSLLPEYWVHTNCWFIKDEQFWTVYHGCCKGHPPLLPSTRIQTHSVCYTGLLHRIT
jgi:hypothetical protein